VGISIMMYLRVVVGGPGYFLGPVVGAAVGVIVPEWMRDVPRMSDWYLPLFGGVVVLMMIWLPDGLMSLPDRIRAKRDSKIASDKRAQAGSASAVAASAMGAQP
jgi:branched-chain amino acid transport system permease protein